MQSDVNVARSDALETIRALEPALGKQDGAGFISLLKQLSATLKVDRLLVEIKRGSFLVNLNRLTISQRVQLLNLAERWGSSADVFGRILSTDIPDNRHLMQELAAARVRHKVRQACQQSSMAKTRFVSVGAHCLAWTLPNRWGLRSAEHISGLFNPLSLASHKVDFLIDQIGRDFDGYVAPEKLRTVASSGGFHLVGRKDGGALWNHHVGEFWSDFGFARFRRNVEAGLDSFRKLLADRQGRVVFLLHLPNASSREHALEQTQRISEVLTRQAPAAVLIGIDTGNHLAPGVEHASFAAAGHVIHAGQPSAEYRWPMGQYYNSPEGVAYEGAIVDAIRTLADAPEIAS